MPDKKPNDKYKKRLPKRVLTDGVMDVYDVLVAFGVTCPARQNAVKKLLCSGQRGYKDSLTDLREAAVNIERAIQIVRDTDDSQTELREATLLDIPAPLPREHRE